MRLGSTQKNVQKLVLPRVVVLLLKVGTTRQTMSTISELKYIFELCYSGRNQVYLFECD